jgi:hypothetical protein
MAWQNQGSAYADVQVVENSLAFLGATHVRDSIPYSGWTLPEYVAVAQTGIQFDILASGPNIDINGDIAAAAQLEAAVPSSVVAMEGANEFNTQNSIYEGVNSIANPPWAQLYGPPLYQAVRAAGTLPGATVIAASMANADAADLQEEGDLSSFVDFANWHTYYGDGDQPWPNIAASVAAAETTAPGKPVMITETGYYTAIYAEQWGGGGVSRHVQAILTLNALFDAFSAGVPTTYIYELLDNIANPPNNDLEDNFGLFLADGTPKQAASAIHNLVAILADPGPQASNFSVGSYVPAITGLPTTAETLVLEKSNGNFYVLLWNEPQVWNETTHSEIQPASSPVTVQIGTAPQAVNIYDPLRSASPKKKWSKIKTVDFELGANPIILEILPPA